MKSMEFLEMLSEIDESVLIRADKHRRPAKRLWRPLSALAAMLAVAVIGTGIGSIIGRGGAAEGGAGGGEDWLEYVGPVLPLTAMQDTAGLEAQRHINYDFSPYISYGDSYHAVATVTDSYTLTNTAAEDRTLTLVYPYSGRLLDGATQLPQITVDGKEISISYYPAPFCGYYYGTRSGDEGSYNISAPTAFDEYRDLLSDQGYFASAYDDLPVLDQPVTVYRITEPRNLGHAAAIAMEFTVDPEKTTVLTYGFGGGQDDPETGFQSRSFFIPTHGNSTDARYIILLGEDTESYRLQGYLNGGCQPGEEAEAEAQVSRYETTLGEVMMQIITDDRQYFKSSWASDPESEVYIADVAITDEQYLGLAAELLTTDGILSENAVERYSFGWLDDIFAAVLSDQRILYLTFELTVPAGASVTVDASMMREPHHSNPLGGKKYHQGYDMATTLGSSLTFTEQTASVSNTDAIRIIDQNFGFDLARGVTEVTLDTSIEHYWMKIRRRSS